MTFTLRSLENEEMVRVEVTTFTGDIVEFVCEGKYLNTGAAEPFSRCLGNEQTIGFSNVKEFRVETMAGMGGAYTRNRKGNQFRPTDW